MGTALDLIAIGDCLELAINGFQGILTNPFNGLFIDHAVVNQIGNGTDLQVVLFGKGFEVRSTGHGPIVVHNLDNDRGRSHARQTSQITSGFSVTGAG